MNNNRGNNRRRGRGNNRPQGGGQQLNRIDSRARGNAPQLLEKYRKLAQDAHLNGDRVQAEYYLQFADHYFRVIADTRSRQEDQRQRGNGERWQEQDGEDGGDDFTVESDFPSFDRPAPRREEREPYRESRENREPREAREPREGREPRENREPREPREGREPREPRDNREGRRHEGRRERVTETAAEPAPEIALGEGVRADEGEPVRDATENPFVRDTRGARGGLRPRGERRPRKGQPAEDAAPAGLDPSSLPPAIGARANDAPEQPPVEAPAIEAAEAPPAPKRRGRPRKVVPEATVPADS